MLVESARREVLLVDVEAVGSPLIDRMLQKRGPDAPPARRIVDEEHLELAIGDARKPKRSPAIEGNRQLRHRAQPLAHLGSHRDDIVLRQKQVRRAHRALPQQGELFDERVAAPRNGDLFDRASGIHAEPFP